MDTFKIIGALPMSERIAVLKKEMLDESRYATIEQARIITKSYRQTEGTAPLHPACEGAEGGVGGNDHPHRAA